MKRSVLVAIMLCGSSLFGCSNGVTQEALDFVEYTEQMGRSNNGNSSFSVISDTHKFKNNRSFHVVYDIVGFNEKGAKKLWDAVKIWTEEKELSMIFYVRTLDQEGNVIGYMDGLGTYYDDEEHISNLERCMSEVWVELDQITPVLIRLLEGHINKGEMYI